MTKAAHGTSFVARTLSLRGVLDHLNPIWRGDGIDSIHVGGLAVKVDGDDCSSPRRNCGIDALRVKVVSSLVRLDRNRNRSGIGNGKPSCNIGVSWDDNLITRPNSNRAQSQMQSIEAVADSNAVVGAAISGKFLLELDQLRTQNI